MNKYYHVHDGVILYRLIVRTMKLTLFLLTFFVLHTSASVYGQKLKLSLKEATLQEVMSEIRKQSRYNVIFQPGVVEIASKITIELENTELEDALNLVFAEQGLLYKIVDRSIIVSKPDYRKNTGSIRIAANYGQQKIEGQVVDHLGHPLVGATIRIKGTNISTKSDAKGNFTLDMEGDQRILIFSYVGYSTKEVNIQAARSPLVVTMQVQEESLNEVSINTGIFQKVDKSYTGSSLTVAAEELQIFGSRNLFSALQYIDPGFVIRENNQTGSNPNQLPDIQIRGNSSLPNINNLDELAGLNTPLIILDGFQSSLQRMLDIDIQDVESVTILKDASATAIYGSRGSNGVIVITTKLPKPDALHITYKVDARFEVADLSAYQVLNAREKLDLEQRQGLFQSSSGLVEQNINLDRYYNYLLGEVNAGVNTDWMSAPLRLGIGDRHHLGLSGGVEAFRYSATAQVNRIEGVMKGSSRNTFSGTINLAYHLNNVKFSNQTTISEGRSYESQYGAFSEYVRLNPYWRAYNEQGGVLNLLGDPGSNVYVGRWSSLPTNPLYNATLSGFDKTRLAEVVNNTSVEWSIWEGVMLRAQIGLSKLTRQKDRYRSPEHTAFTHYSTADVFRKGDYLYEIGNGFGYDAAVNLQYSKHFANRHLLFAGIDVNVRSQDQSDYGFLAEGFSNPSLNFISMALQYAQGQKPHGSESLVNAIGVTSNINYLLDDKYFADLSLRFDGSSQFGANNKIAPFWSVGLGWNLHKERFLIDASSVDRLKIRGSAGITGSQNFAAYQAVSTYRYYTDRRYFDMIGVDLLSLGNDDLKWQQTMKYNIGMDAELFNRRLQLVADYYYSKTQNLVSSISIPASTGFTSYVENIGEMQNKGFEFRTTGVILDKGRNSWYLSLTAGVARNRNKILRTSSALKEAQRSRQMAQETEPSNLYLEGYSTNAIWVVPSLGIDPSNGKEVYQDQDGNPTYTWSGEYLRAMGNTEPDYMGNLSLRLRYGAFTVNTAFGYRLGGQLYNQTLINKVENADYRYNVDRRVYEDRWENPGDEVQFKSRSITAPTYKTSRFVEDENTLICQNIFLQYQPLAPAWVKRLRMRQLQFSATVDQPFRWSTVKLERGIAYPFSRQFSLGLTATF